MLGTSPRPRPTLVHPDEEIWDGVLLDLDVEEIANELIHASEESPPVPSRFSSLEHYNAENHANNAEVASHFQRAAKLVDVSVPMPNGNGRYSPDESSIALLECSTGGFRFDLYEPENEPEKIQIVRGTLLKPLSELDDPRVIAYLKREQGELRRKDALLGRDVLKSNVYAVVPKTNVMRLTDDQAMLLLGVLDTERRIQLYHDFEWFDFIRGLCIGDIVHVETIHRNFRRTFAESPSHLWKFRKRAAEVPKNANHNSKREHLS